MRPGLCRECFKLMEGSAWPLCDACTEKRVTQAVKPVIDEPFVDMSAFSKYAEEDVPTVPTGDLPLPRNPVPTMEQRAAWFHHNQTSVAEQVSRAMRPSLLQSLWVRIQQLTAKIDMFFLRFL